MLILPPPSGSIFALPFSVDSASAEWTFRVVHGVPTAGVMWRKARLDGVGSWGPQK